MRKGNERNEFTGQMMDLWAYRHGVEIDFSRSGKPTDNAHCESFNGTFRAEYLDTKLVQNLPGTPGSGWAVSRGRKEFSIFGVED